MYRTYTEARRFTFEKAKKSKPIGGEERLTDKDINRLQNYFDIAIRSNTDNL